MKKLRRNDNLDRKEEEMFGFLAKAAGWAFAHKDALYAGFKVFKKLRGRRKATEESGESVKDYYLREGKKAVVDVAEEFVGQ
jgi:hypothetical protein